MGMGLHGRESTWISRKIRTLRHKEINKNGTMSKEQYESDALWAWSNIDNGTLRNMNMGQNEHWKIICLGQRG